MNRKIRILLVEDDVNLSFLLKEYLEDNGFEAVACENGDLGLAAWKNGHFDFCIFDIMLPKLDGFSLLKAVREKDKKTPVIMLTARSMKEDKIQGFNMGVDDYVTKPFDEEELLCRINAILTRTANKTNERKEQTCQIGKYKFDASNQALIFGDNFKRLTKKECQVLEMLCQSKNRITKRDEILNNIWGDNNYFAGRSLDVFITKLRKYLREDPTVKIDGIPTVGYILADQ
ncbi:MAG: response regulator transcription factor [Bacteroidales bacterium]